MYERAWMVHNMVDLTPICGASCSKQVSDLGQALYPVLSKAQAQPGTQTLSKPFHLLAEFLMRSASLLLYAFMPRSGSRNGILIAFP